MRKRGKVLSFIIMLTMIISSVTTAYAQVSDIEKHWAKEEINYMLDKGYLTGYPDGTFRPEDNISKAEFYKIINNLMGYEQKTDFGFKDVRLQDWFYSDVAKAIKAGYLTDAEYLYPNDYITREEVARIIGYTFKLKENAESSAYFKDYKLISPNTVGFIGTLKEKGYIAGFPDGTFGPINNISRAEVVKMLYNILIAEGIPQKTDLTAYKAALAAVKESSYTKQSWAEYQKVVLANVVTEENSKEEVESATAAIIAAQSKLVKVTVSVYVPVTPSIKANLSAYNAALAAVKQSDYTEESWAVYQAVVLANVVTANNTQARVDEATAAIIEAQNNLVKIGEPVDPEPVVDKTALAAKIVEAQGLDEEEYTEETWEDLELALSAAVLVNENTDATQEEVNDALVDLSSAITALEEKTVDPEPVVDKTALAAKIAVAQGLVENNYTVESWANLQTALSAAIAVNDNTEATQEEVNDAVAELTAAITALVEKPEPVVDKTALAAKIAVAQGLVENNYTVESWANLQTALSAAIAVNDNTGATQEQVDAALSSLTAAITTLVEKPEPVVDKTVLAAKIVEAQGLDEDNYTVESWANLQTALSAAIAVNDNTEATQEQVNAALASLTAAITALVEKPEPVVDKTALAAKIVEAQGLVENNYTVESWANLQTALSAAIAVNDNTEATQEEVNDALTDLSSAITALVEKPEPVVDKTALAAKIVEAQGLDEEEYTEETWEDLELALSAAVLVNENTDATQEEVNDALVDLSSAITALEEKTVDPEPVVDKTALAAKIAVAQGLVENNYTVESWANLQTALSAAIAVNEDTEATQEEVNDAVAELTAAITALVEKPEEVDKTALAAKIAVAQGLVENNYTVESWANLQTALSAAIAVNDNTEATQEQVDAALSSLTAAITTLVEKPEPVVDKTALAAKIVEAQGLDEDNYTVESWANLQTALSAAIAVNDNTEATQEQVNAALASLTAAITALVEKPEPVVDKTALAAKIAVAQGLDEDNYTVESWENLQTALSAAIAVNNNTEATQEQVNAALASLTAAITALVEKPEPQVVAYFHPQNLVPTFGKISIQVANVNGAAKFDVTYHLAPNEQGEVIKTTKMINIGAPLDTVGYPSMFYNPSTTGFNTIVIKIYDLNDNLLYTFENVIPLLPI